MSIFIFNAAYFIHVNWLLATTVFISVSDLKQEKFNRRQRTGCGGNRTNKITKLTQLFYIKEACLTLNELNANTYQTIFVNG